MANAVTNVPYLLQLQCIEKICYGKEDIVSSVCINSEYC